MHLLAEPKGCTGQNWLKVVRVQTKLLLKQAGLVISICILPVSLSYVGAHCWAARIC